MEFYQGEIELSLSDEELKLLKETSELLQNIYLGMKERSCDCLYLKDSGKIFSEEKIDEVSVMLRDFYDERLAIE